MMWMWLLVCILVIAAVITKLKRSNRIVMMKWHESMQPPTQNRTSEVEHMLCCDQCGIYFPDSEAVYRGGKVFCSKEHSIIHFSV